MDAIILARLQFAFTTIYHFFFVPLTLGLSVLVAVMETIYVVTGQQVYKHLTKFWGKLFLINFTMGVVTGIVLEFQFGMNWSEYSRFVGDIFGAPLAIEALLAFFLESTFLGIWVFGWEKLSKRMHLATIWLVALGSNLSALWILIANSFMHQPTGYVLQNGRAQMVDFFALLTNPHVWLQFPHTVMAGFTTAAFFVMGISAYHIIKQQNREAFQHSFKIAALLGTFAILLVIIVGHSQGQHLARVQPMKLAAAEALWKTENPAAFSLITIIDATQKGEIYSLRIPRILSLLIYNRLEGEVKGIYDLQAEYERIYGPGDYIPPVAVTYWTFRIMVGAGFSLLGLALIAIWLSYFRKSRQNNLLFRLLLWSIPLPYIANTAGWILTEVGRTPWVVYGLLKIEQAVSPNVSKGMVLLSLLSFALIYGLLMAVDVYLLAKFAKSDLTSGVELLSASFESGYLSGEV